MAIKPIIDNVYEWLKSTFATKPRWILHILMHPDKYYTTQSYFPESEHHAGKWHVISDQIRDVIKYGYPNKFYYSYGFDVKNKTQKSEYLHYAQFNQWCKRLNERNAWGIGVLRDKLLFGMYTDSLGVASAGNIAMSSDGKIYGFKQREWYAIPLFLKDLDDGEWFAKPYDGECGRGIFSLRKAGGVFFINDEKSEVAHIVELFCNNSYLLQSRIRQHPQMASLHAASINTLRLITIRNRRTGEIDIFSVILRIGTGGSVVDNTSQGGMAVGVDTATGRLKDYGYYKPEYGTRSTKHPDSGIEFLGFQVPFFQQACEQAKLLHRFLPGVGSVGWDIGIGEDGPVFVEGNENWEINGPQICNGGGKRLMSKYL